MHQDTTCLFNSSVADSTVIGRTDSVHLTNEIAEHINTVGSEIHKASTTTFFRLRAPFVWCQLVLFQKRHTSVDYLSEPSGVHPRPDLLEAGVKPKQKTDLQMNTVGIAGSDHLLAFLWRECHRFIAKDVQTAFRCSDYLFAV